jgi:DNA-binding HxlR family transcriptional regulator
MKRLDTDECGFATALNAIGGKWKLEILWEVTLAPRRFGALRRLLPGVSEADGLVWRQVFPGAVQKVEYSVTDVGRTLNEAVGVMSAWGKAQERRMVLHPVVVAEKPRPLIRLRA